jgi:hypothetical protein
MLLGWSDGTSFVPLDHAPLSSTKKKNRIQGITKELDGWTCGARRRKEALTKSTDSTLSMVKRAVGLFILAKYLLMDNWFTLHKKLIPLEVLFSDDVYAKQASCGASEHFHHYVADRIGSIVDPVCTAIEVSEYFPVTEHQSLIVTGK